MSTHKTMLLVALVALSAQAQQTHETPAHPVSAPEIQAVASASSNNFAATKWKGVCWMPPGKKTYPLLLQIAGQNGSNLVGVLHHPATHASTTKIKGTLANQRLTFTEYELIQGKDVYLPTVYAGEINGDRLEGIWRTRIFFIPIKGKFSLERQQSE